MPSALYTSRCFSQFASPTKNSTSLHLSACLQQLPLCLAVFSGVVVRVSRSDSSFLWSLALRDIFSSILYQTDSLDDLEKEAAAWAPRSSEELTLELQLACVHPRVCALAASARIGVPDPEDAFSPLPNKKARHVVYVAYPCFGG